LVEVAAAPYWVGGLIATTGVMILSMSGRSMRPEAG
jgi:hypothetical protein